MGIVKNEQDVKRDTQFLTYESGEMGNQLMLKSHMYEIKKHFIKSVSRSVICKGGECLYCAANYNKAKEFNYMVFLNGQTGFIDIKQTVFFDIQQISRAQKRDARQISWTVIKEGSGLDTKYTTSKDDNLAPEDYERLQSELDSNTDRLIESMERHEEDLEVNYTQYMGQIRDQATPKRKEVAIAAEVERIEAEAAEQKKKSEELAAEIVEDEVPENTDPSQEVHPDEIPF